MKQFIILFFITLLFLQLGYRLSIISNFELNREYIKKTLCINRDNVKSNCNGQCYLMKQMQENEDRATDFAIETLLKIEPLAGTEALQYFFSRFKLSESHYSSDVYRLYHSDFQFSMFKPPQG